ncbi:MAG: hypothetical protein J5792_05465 [Bacteroidales bacterium]|nr:hypothetical protein [Bacteroidales bacterium]
MMEVLAVNHGKGLSFKEKLGVLYASLWMMAIAAYLILMVILFCRNFFLSFFLTSHAIGYLLIVILKWNVCLLWNRAEETISIQEDALVIERRGCLFCRHKKIPFSTISGVDALYYENTVSLEEMFGKLPHTLKLSYSKCRLLFLGICMEDADCLRVMEKIRSNIGDL